MKRVLAIVAILALGGGLLGCFGEADECSGGACDEANLNLGKNVEQEGQQQEQQQEVEDKNTLPGSIEQYEPVPPQVVTNPWDDDDFVYVHIDAVDEVIPEQLTIDEQVKIDVLRGAIEQGLDLGKIRYLEAVSLSLAELNVVNDYEGTVTDGFADLVQQPEECPFAKYYDNGFQPSGITCDYLIDIAKVEVYSKLTQNLDAFPLPVDVTDSEHGIEANFWYEQGAISGVEEERAMVRTDLKQRNLCNQNPTPVESSYDKGVVIGRQLLAQKINNWLANKGHTPDYPTMSNPIQVCNADQTMILPAKQAAMQFIPEKIVQEPLCVDYQPPTQEGIMQYNQAIIDYEKGIKEGVSEEFALAAVRVFEQIPCNVSDPIVVDLDGDGLELLPISQGTNFDLYATGSRQAVAWVAPDDALLVMDRNGNGLIDNGSELFGNLDGIHRDGFSHLADLDSNRDGVLTAQDAEFAKLALWKDANSNGTTEAGELAFLNQINAGTIHLDARESSLVSAGQQIPSLSVITTASGKLLCGDAYLTSAPYPRLAR